MIDFNQMRDNMVFGQILPERIVDSKVIEAFRTIPRELFVPEIFKSSAYIDGEIKLNNDRYLGRPSFLARLIQSADIKDSNLVLDVGTGFGYVSAVLSKLASTVVSIEKNNFMLDHAKEELSKLGADNVVLLKGDLNQGCSEHAPYDAIIISGAVQEVPELLFEQLGEGGCLLAVVTKDFSGVAGKAIKYTRFSGSINENRLFDAEVSLISDFKKPYKFKL